jgi:hypothetical protein
VRRLGLGVFDVFQRDFQFRQGDFVQAERLRLAGGGACAAAEAST